MRLRLLALVAVIAVAASAVVVVAAAQPSANGLPRYTNGYQKWSKINRKPIRGGATAHSGIKNVYASKKQVRKKYPNGTVIVKTIARAREKGLPYQVAVMRKVKGRWQYVEYQRAGKRYGVLAKGRLCQSCHAQAKASDFVFTKR